MILFKLRCGESHEFEGWFRDNAAYDQQQAGGEIACPVCGDCAVEKAPMAPRLGRGSRHEETAAPAAVPAMPANPPRRPAGRPERPPTASDLRRALQEIRHQVETNCDYVGPHFADEARAIHRGEKPARGIYGEASPAESKKLADDGIQVACIPWLPPNDA